MTSQAPTKTPPVDKADSAQPDAPARVRPKLSLHYGAKTPEERK
ncbi:hypothetical protein ACFX59_03535 [Sphingomonas sp. NCPPB 2930]|nr:MULTISPECIES: hypothetical protein [unclassified Sphingomonas]MDR6113374.1 hypothetical protein [Sphingomonas sp. SORGH_AS_0789]MDR6149265.1 hypothetical protein [Sphingomonas sp. SORGH_AS_0742]